MNCILETNGARRGDCRREDCIFCGWNEAVELQRKQQIENGGMAIDPKTRLTYAPVYKLKQDG